MVVGRGKPMFLTRTVLVLISAVLCLPGALVAQDSKSSATNQAEQADFGIEEAEIRRPVELSRAALDALSKDERVASCLENEGLSAKQLTQIGLLRRKFISPDRRNWTLWPYRRSYPRYA